ncbi:hypothetical protein SAMN03080615_02664 [Amphritea atlantica]|uniref:Uncharacterized protein n=1 Tax=Amphritea atlantica TaxID=355243 RepID=A0A1H9IMR2_9GAMM|nr:hypothetical protein [Amphritea atlantica]SEQ76031.1 hypothetical protein SAMN03080615_02664 [Amphritea atlantica]
MKHNATLTADERQLLKRVHHGDFDSAPLVPVVLQPLISKGLIEPVRSIMMPIMPSRYRFRLTSLGERLLQQKKC